MGAGKIALMGSSTAKGPRTVCHLVQEKRRIVAINATGTRYQTKGIARSDQKAGGFMKHMRVEECVVRLTP